MNYILLAKRRDGGNIISLKEKPKGGKVVWIKNDVYLEKWHISGSIVSFKKWYIDNSNCVSGEEKLEKVGNNQYYFIH